MLNPRKKKNTNHFQLAILLVNQIKHNTQFPIPTVLTAFRTRLIMPKKPDPKKKNINVTKYVY